WRREAAAMRTRVLIGVGVVALVAAGAVLAIVRRQGGDQAAPLPAQVRPLTIGLWGDIPYTSADVTRLPSTIGSMNAANLDSPSSTETSRAAGPATIASTTRPSTASTS
ncbi:MAG: hypothetical protein M3011_09135, partial [Actinomycetota bacterium]|nr:hypothetical protein [Actinomycetota bacterium]